MPFLLNYIVCFYTFFRLTSSKKKYFFIFPLLDLYPQYEAAKLIYFIYKDPVKGKKEKRDFDQNISLHEVFLEAVPTTVIITVIWFKEGRTIFRNGTFIDGPSEFLITYSLSI